MGGHWVVFTLTLFVTFDLGVTSNDEFCAQQLDVAIVGAGPAGSYSAYRLRHAGKQVGLFEYSDRVGGRTYNYKLPNTPDVILQLGAMRFIAGAMPILERLVAELGLETTNFTEGFGRVGRTRFFLRGQSFSKEEISNADVPYNLRIDEKENQHRLYEHYLELLVGGYHGGQVSRKDLMTFQIDDGRYLYQLKFDEAIGRVGSSEGLAFLKDTSSFKSIVGAEASAAFAFHNALGDEFNGYGIHTLKQGMMAIAEGLVDEFLMSSTAHFLTKNMQLKTITKKSVNNYLLEFKPTQTRQGETEVLEFKDTWRVCAKKVILALPVFALRQVDWQPLRDDRVEEAFSVIQNDPVNRVYMTFSRPWWLSHYDDAYVHIGDKNAVTNSMYDWKNSEVTGDYILMASYVSGNQSNYQKHLQNVGTKIRGSEPGVKRVTGALARTLLKELGTALNVRYRDVPLPKTSMAQFWTVYPFGGGWVIPKAGYNFDELMRIWRRPSITDDVFVVGTDYSWGVMVGWMEGGLQTVDIVMKEYF